MVDNEEPEANSKQKPLQLKIRNLIQKINLTLEGHDWRSLLTINNFYIQSFPSP